MEGLQSDKPKRRHVCTTCGHSFTKRSDLIRHERVHTGEKPFKCESCGAGFSQASSLKSHYRKHTGERPFRCQYCGRSFVHSHRLKSHILKFHPHPPLSPNACGVECDCCSDLEKQVSSCVITCKKTLKSDTVQEVAQQNGVNCCDHPGQKVLSKQDVSQNDKDSFENPMRHTESPAYSSRIENQNEREENLKDFRKPYNSKWKSTYKSFMCDACGLFHDDEVSLLKHHLQMHNNDKLFKCGSCDGRFPSPSSLEKHQMVHLVVNTFECGICSASFTSSEKLKTHKNVHTTREEQHTFGEFGMKIIGCHSCSLKEHSTNSTTDSFKDNRSSCTCNCKSSVSLEKEVFSHNSISFPSLESFKPNDLYHSGAKFDEYQVISSSCCSVFVIQKASINQGLRVASQTNSKHSQNEITVQSMSGVHSSDSNNTVVIESRKGEEQQVWSSYRGIDGIMGDDSSSPLISHLNGDESFPTFQDHFLSETENMASVCEKVTTERTQNLSLCSVSVPDDTLKHQVSQEIQNDQESTSHDQGYVKMYSQDCGLHSSDPYSAEHIQESPMSLFQYSPLSPSDVLSIAKERMYSLAENSSDIAEVENLRDITGSSAPDESDFQAASLGLVNRLLSLPSNLDLNRANEDLAMFPDKLPLEKEKESQADKIYSISLSELKEGLAHDPINFPPPMDLTNVTQVSPSFRNYIGIDQNLQNENLTSIHCSSSSQQQTNSLTCTDVTVKDDKRLSPELIVPYYNTMLHSNNLSQANEEESIKTDMEEYCNDSTGDGMDNFSPIKGHSFMAEIQTLASGEKQSNAADIENFMMMESVLLQDVTLNEIDSLPTVENNRQIFSSSSISSEVSRRGEGKVVSDTQKLENAVKIDHLPKDGESQEIEGHQSDQEKELKCANCPLGLFDASVISVLCEDECFGDMLERKSRSEEGHSEVKTDYREKSLHTVRSEREVSDSSQSNITVTKSSAGEKGITVNGGSGRVEKELVLPSAMHQDGKKVLKLRNKVELAQSNASEFNNIDNKVPDFPSHIKNKEEDMNRICKSIEEISSNACSQVEPDHFLTLTDASNELLEKQSFPISCNLKPVPSLYQLAKEQLNRTQYTIRKTANWQSLLHEISLSSVFHSQYHSTLQTEGQGETVLFSNHSSHSKQDMITSRKKGEKMRPIFKSKEKYLIHTSVKKMRTAKRILRSLTIGHFKYRKLKTGLTERTDFHEHLRATRVRSYTCNQCNAKFNQFSRFKRHQKEHFQEHSHACPICHLSFVFQSALQTEFKSHIGNANTSIKVLEMGSTASNEASDINGGLGLRVCHSNATNDPDVSGNGQQKIGTDQKRAYLCQFCGESLTNLQSLNHHLVSHKQKSYECDVCTSTFKNKSNLVKHSRIHNNERPYKCEVCSKSFTQMTNLHVHMRIHTGERPYSCKTCQASFAHSQALKLHMRFHAKEMRFVCTTCAKGFVVKAALEKHVQSHTGKKPYVCNSCGGRLSSKSSLSRHVKKHKLEQELLPFSCPVCSAQFAQSGHLKLHMKSHSTFVV